MQYVPCLFELHVFARDETSVDAHSGYRRINLSELPMFYADVL